jgi:hypothetical protein
MRQPEAASSPPALGAFGDTLGAYYHQESSSTASASWADETTFAITRLRSDVGLLGTSQPIPEEAALHVSIAIQPVPLAHRRIPLSGQDDGLWMPHIRKQQQTAHSRP